MPAGYRAERGSDMASGEGTSSAFFNPALRTTVLHGKGTGRARGRWRAHLGLQNRAETRQRWRAARRG
jgi:hypothetical protein